LSRHALLSSRRNGRARLIHEPKQAALTRLSRIISSAQVRDDEYAAHGPNTDPSLRTCLFCLWRELALAAALRAAKTRRLVWRRRSRCRPVTMARPALADAAVTAHCTVVNHPRHWGWGWGWGWGLGVRGGRHSSDSTLNPRPPTLIPRTPTGNRYPETETTSL
jgi:hypothetical protein